jgi:hypothetical protein
VSVACFPSPEALFQRIEFTSPTFAVFSMRIVEEVDACPSVIVSSNRRTNP